jgi:hypothetical protein
MWVCSHTAPLAAEPSQEGWVRAVHDPRSASDKSADTTVDGGGAAPGKPPATAAAAAAELARVEKLTLEIMQAPAEFTLPVKQDRQFMPPFRVKVRVMPVRAAACRQATFVRTCALRAVRSQRATACCM